MISCSDDSPTLSEKDVRKIGRLLGAVVAVRGDIHQKRRLLMDELCAMIDATAWVWAMSEFHPDKPPSSIDLEHGGFTGERFARYLDAINHPAMEPVTRPSSHKLQARGVHLTRTRFQMDPNGQLEKSAAGLFGTKRTSAP